MEWWVQHGGRMTRLAVAIAVLAACNSSDPIGDGAPFTACTQCGPGAISGGRFVAWEDGGVMVIANRQGTVARVIDSELSWLRSDFTTEAWKTFDQQIIDVGLDDRDDGAAIAIGTYVDPEAAEDYGFSDAAVIAFGPDHAQRWSDDLGDIYSAEVVASPAIIAVVTDAAQINGTTISSNIEDYSLVGLSATDGSVAWHKPISGAMAFAPDGTLIVAGTFADTLDLGGTTTPITTTGIDGFVAALDPATGDGRWVVQLDGKDTLSADVYTVAVGPSGEVAIDWTTDFDARPSTLISYDSTGVERWTLPIDYTATALVTDGDHIFASGGSFAQYSATGPDWQQPIVSTESAGGDVLALADDGSLVASIFSAETAIGDPQATTTVGGLSWFGDGLALFDLVH